MEQRKKKKNSRRKKNTHTYIWRIDTEIAIGVPRVIFFLFSNQIWESLRTLEREEERYAIEWITDEKSCGGGGKKKRKKNSQINRWNSMPERNSALESFLSENIRFEFVYITQRKNILRSIRYYYIHKRRGSKEGNLWNRTDAKYMGRWIFGWIRVDR